LWYALPDHRRLAVADAAAKLFTENAPLIKTKSIGSKKRRRVQKTFVGKDAARWLVASGKAADMEDAVKFGELMLAGNLIRDLDEGGSFQSSSKRTYGFVVEDQDRDPAKVSPSVVTLVHQAMRPKVPRCGVGKATATQAPFELVEGWLKLRIGAKKETRRYCVLARYPIAYVLYYYNSDIGAIPKGFVNLQTCKFQVSHQPTRHHPTKPQDTFMIRATSGAGETSIEICATATSGFELERWIAGFIHAGAAYTEAIPPNIQNAPDIYGFTAFNAADKPVSFDAFRGKPLLIVIADAADNSGSSSSAATAPAGSKKQFEELAKLAAKWKDSGLCICIFPGTQLMLASNSRANSSSSSGAVRAAAPIIHTNTSTAGKNNGKDGTGSSVGSNLITMASCNFNGCGCPRLAVPSVLAYAKSNMPGPCGTWVAANFEKFLFDSDGKPVQRFAAHAPMGVASDLNSEIRRLVGPIMLATGPNTPTTSQLMISEEEGDDEGEEETATAEDALPGPGHAAVQSTAPAAGPPPVILGRKVRTPQLNRGNTVPANLMGGGASTVHAKPRTPLLRKGKTIAAGIADSMHRHPPKPAYIDPSVKYFTVGGAGPFPRSPITTPTSFRPPPHTPLTPQTPTPAAGRAPPGYSGAAAHAGKTPTPGQEPPPYIGSATKRSGSYMDTVGSSPPPPSSPAGAPPPHDLEITAAVIRAAASSAFASLQQFSASASYAGMAADLGSQLEYTDDIGWCVHEDEAPSIACVARINATQPATVPPTADGSSSDGVVGATQPLRANTSHIAAAKARYLARKVSTPALPASQAASPTPAPQSPAQAEGPASSPAPVMCLPAARRRTNSTSTSTKRVASAATIASSPASPLRERTNSLEMHRDRTGSVSGEQPAGTKRAPATSSLTAAAGLGRAPTAAPSPLRGVNRVQGRAFLIPGLRLPVNGTVL
jgi:glutathione peroxidase-family protein